MLGFLRIPADSLGILGFAKGFSRRKLSQIPSIIASVTLTRMSSHTSILETKAEGQSWKKKLEAKAGGQGWRMKLEAKAGSQTETKAGGRSWRPKLELGTKNPIQFTGFLSWGQKSHCHL